MKRSFDQANLGQPSNFRAGDWMCTQCGAHNYASKSLCFRCGALPATLPTSLPTMTATGGGLDFKQSAAANMQQMQQFQNLALLQNMSGMGSMGAFGGMQMQANYGAAAVTPGMGMMANYGNYGQAMHGGHGGGGGMGVRQQGQYTSSGQQRGIQSYGNKDMRPGDWMCMFCKAHNYRDKVVCFKCKGPNVAQMLQEHGIFIDVAKFRAGDWLCISCKAHNYASKHSCYKCSAAKPQSENTGKIEGAAESLLRQLSAITGVSPQIAQVLSSSSRKLPENFRPGDWICPGCNGHNYHSKTFCFRCNLAKPANAEENALKLSGGKPPGFRQGDWMCSSCNAHNYASKSVCYKCGASKEEPLPGPSGPPPGHQQYKNDAKSSVQPPASSAPSSSSSSSSPPSSPVLTVKEDTRAAGEAAADFIIDEADKAIAATGRFTIAFSGGSLPKIVGEALKSKGVENTNKWFIFFTDERCVALDDEESNFKNVDQHVLQPLKIPKENVVHIDGEQYGDAAKAAKLYEESVHKFFEQSTCPVFDLILLGMGPDGHTCSLFPEHKLLDEAKSTVAAITDSPKPPSSRITFTFPVLNAAKAVAFVCCGGGKSGSLKAVIEGEEGSEKQLPAGMVKNKRIFWYVDEAAAAELSKKKA